MFSTQATNFHRRPSLRLNFATIVGNFNRLVLNIPWTTPGLNFATIMGIFNPQFSSQARVEFCDHHGDFQSIYLHIEGPNLQSRGNSIHGSWIEICDHHGDFQSIRLHIQGPTLPSWGNSIHGSRIEFCDQHGEFQSISDQYAHLTNPRVEFCDHHGEFQFNVLLGGFVPQDWILRPSRGFSIH